MSKKLILLVHGGNSQTREDDGVEFREIVKNTYSLDLGKPSFGEVMDRYLDTERFEVLSPLFPNAVDANYDEWARFLEQVLTSKIGLFTEIVFIGHSLGTVTLQRYLSENDVYQKFGLKILQLHLVGCCKYEGKFEIGDNWGNIENQVEQIYLYHSKDDMVCDFSEGEFYASHLPTAEFLVFTDRGHFEMEKIPELIERIEKL